MTPETHIEFDGVNQSINDWALDYGITPAIIIGRLERGAFNEKAITKPMTVYFSGQRLPVFSDEQLVGDRTIPRKPTGRTYVFEGRALTVIQWAEVSGMSVSAIRKRLRKGWSIERTLTTPLDPRGTTRRGVASNFDASKGTGGGSTSQESPNITFSEKVEDA